MQASNFIRYRLPAVPGGFLCLKLRSKIWKGFGARLQIRSFRFFKPKKSLAPFGSM